MSQNCLSFVQMLFNETFKPPSKEETAQYSPMFSHLYFAQTAF